MYFNPFRRDVSPISRQKGATEDQQQSMSDTERKKFAEGWTARRVKEVPSRGVSISRQDKNIAQSRVLSMQQLERNGLMTNVPLLAERFFAEAADMDGGVSRHGARWFGDTAVTYFCNHYDDALRGSDVLLFVIDEDNERIAHPLAIDVTTNAEGVEGKIATDIGTVMGTQERRVYWYDTFSTDPTAVSFDTPKEGTILTSHATVLLPSDLIRQFFQPSCPAMKAQNIMQTLGPAVVFQIQKQLEMQAALLLGEISLLAFQDGRRRYRSLTTREELAHGLEDERTNPHSHLSLYHQRLIPILQCSLEAIWKRSDRPGRFSKRKDLPEGSIPEILLTFPELPAEKYDRNLREAA